MIKKVKKIGIMKAFVFFLLFMFVMTIVSRVVNASYIPQVDIYKVTGVSMDIENFGRGVVKYGIPMDERLNRPIFDQELYYVQGYITNDEYIENIKINDMVDIVFATSNAKETGTIVAKMYDYKEDITEVILLLENKEYTSGEKVDFIVPENRVRFPYCIPNTTLYEDENGSFYVYILENYYSILGNETFAVRVNIDILAKNDLRTAIKMNEKIDANTKIIGKHEKLKHGERVREKEY